MEVVNTLDIDGSQWEIQDVEARNKIAVLEDSLSPKDLPDAKITMKNGYTCKSIRITDCYKAGKIIFAYLRIEDLSGNNVGGTGSMDIASTNLIPKRYTTFLARDYRAPATVTCALEQDGNIGLGASTGIKNGDNVIIGEIIFAEA